MIQIIKPKTDPTFMNSSLFAKMRIELKKYYAKPKSKRRQHKPPYIPLPLSTMEKIRSALMDEFRGKCAYCESKINSVRHGDFDHFRPKSSAKGFNNEFSLDHYWKYAFKWQNMYMSCEICNRYKLNWFPVDGRRAPLTSTLLQTQKTEKRLLIDPCNDDPSEHLKFLESGKVTPLSTMGETTIEILKLNRKDLVEGRNRQWQALTDLVGLIEQKHSQLEVSPLVEQLAQLIIDTFQPKSEKEYAGALREYIHIVLKDNHALIQLITTVDKSSQIKTALKRAGAKPAKILQPIVFPAKTESLTKRFNISKIEIKNFKSIELLSIDFPKTTEKKEPWLMLLGENSVGKSSFLQAIALTLMGDVYRKRIRIKAKDILKKGTSSGFVLLHQEDQTSIELHFTENGFTSNTKLPPTYLLAYGSTRLFPNVKLKPEQSTGQVRAKNMFQPEVALFADNWLVSLHKNNPTRFDYAARALISMLGTEIEDANIRLEVKSNDIFVVYSNPKRTPDSLRSLSDGFKSVIALACDIMQALMQSNSTMEIAEGIVLLDEIGTHLHPRWKMRVVNSFRNAFPKLQFIVSTHDPLCLKGLNKGEVVVLDKDENNKVYPIFDLPDPKELKADQLLSSRFFGLNSTIDVELENEFNEYYALLGKSDKITPAEEKRLIALTKLLKDKKHLGDSLREEIAYFVIDSLLAKDRALYKNTKVEKLKEITVNILQEIWNKTPMEQKQYLKYDKA